MLEILKYALIIVGTIIGAGFSSGQELNKFFISNGLGGIVGILISILIIGFIIYKSLNIIRKRNISNNKEFLEIIKSNNKYFNATINIFLLISFCIMIAGFGSLFKQEFNISIYMASFIMSIFVFLCLINKNIFTKISVGLTAVSIVVIIICGIYNIEIKNNINLNYKNDFIWIVDSILYASYNLILTIPILPTLTSKIKGVKDNKMIVITAVIILIILASFIIGLILNLEYTNYEMPVLVAISSNYNLRNMYRIVIFLSIFTTAISIGRSFLESNVKDKNNKNKVAFLICVLSVLMSNIGFANLIAMMYPIFGMLGIFEVLKIAKFKA